MRLLGCRGAGTFLTSLTLKHYGGQPDLEAFLQEMPDYLVAEMGRYAVRVALYYYAKLDIA